MGRTIYVAAAVVVWISLAFAGGVRAQAPAVQAGQAQAAEVPDLSGLDADALRVLCEQLYLRIAALEQEVQELRAKVGSAYGGAEASVDGDTVAMQQGSWTVQITLNPEPDLAPLYEQIAAEQAKLTGTPAVPGINARLDKARQDLARMEAEQERRYTGSSVKTVSKYSRSDLEPARQAVRALEQEKRQVDLRIAQIQRQIQKLQTIRELAGTLEDGTPVTIVAQGVHYMTGASLQVGQTYQITGSGYFTSGRGKINLTGAVPVAGTTP